MRRLISALVAAIAILGAAPVLAAELVMFERAGCPYCARFDAEVGKIYPKTDEAARAPLRRVDINGPRPADLAEIDFGAFTPTFVLVDGGHERGRIRGYPGEESFYGMLDSMLRDLDSAKTASSAP